MTAEGFEVCAATNYLGPYLLTLLLLPHLRQSAKVRLGSWCHPAPTCQSISPFFLPIPRSPTWTGEACDRPLSKHQLLHNLTTCVLLGVGPACGTD